MENYTAGDVAEFFAVVVDVKTKQPVDPTTLTFKYRVGAGATVTLTYAGASVPAVGIIARTGLGTYEAHVDTTGLDGFWTVTWQSTGIGQAIFESTGRVSKPLLA